MKYELRGAKDILDITPDQLGNARLITVDAENVITAYGDPTLRKDALDMLRSQPHRHIAIATNNKNSFFVESLVRALSPHVPVFSGIQYANKKQSPDMFLAAADHFGIPPDEAIHIDDQYLSHRGARQAGFLGGILVRPYGNTEHLGVKLGRVVDSSVRTTKILQATISGFITDGIDG